MRYLTTPMHIGERRVREAVKAFGGQMTGRHGRIRSPGKARHNRSTVLFPNPNLRFGVGVHIHNYPEGAVAFRRALAEQLGWEDKALGAKVWTPTQSIIGGPDGIIAPVAEASSTEAKTLARCQAIWTATHATGDPLKSYLLGTRGLSANCYGDGLAHALRMHPDLPFWKPAGETPDGSPAFKIAFRSPAMIARITDCQSGAMIGIHCTWLTPEGTKHPGAGSNVRKMKGRAKGGTVALAGPDANGLIAVAEGIESALAFRNLMGTPCHAALSCNGIAAWTPPQGTRAVLIAHDDDANGAGREAADRLAIRLAALGVESRLYPPAAAHGAFAGCCDWNDALLGHRTGGAS